MPFYTLDDMREGAVGLSAILDVEMDLHVELCAGWGLSPADLARRLRHQAIGRPGDPDDIAQAVAYLAGPAASFITGQALVVDGGGLCHLPSFADGGHVQA